MTKPLVGNYVSPSTVDRALELAEMAYQLRLIDKTSLYGTNNLACRLCGYSMTGIDSVDRILFPYEPPESDVYSSTYDDGSVVPDHWLMHHTPIDLVMRAAERKGDTDE